MKRKEFVNSKKPNREEFKRNKRRKGRDKFFLSKRELERRKKELRKRDWKERQSREELKLKKPSKNNRGEIKKSKRDKIN